MIKLNKKEQRLFNYLLDETNSMNIGDICKALHTTVYTLLAKTEPRVRQYIKEYRAIDPEFPYV